MSGFTNYHNIMVLVGSTRVPPKYLLYGLGKRPRNEKSPKYIIIFNILGAINSATSRWSSEIEHAHHYTKVITNLGDYIDLQMISSYWYVIYLFSTMNFRNISYRILATYLWIENGRNLFSPLLPNLKMLTAEREPRRILRVTC